MGNINYKVKSEEVGKTNGIGEMRGSDGVGVVLGLWKMRKKYVGKKTFKKSCEIVM